MDELITALKALLETNLGSTYSYSYGENLVPEKYLFPLIEVVPVSTQMEVNGTGGSRKYNYDFKVQLKVDIKDYLDSNTNVSVVSHMQALIQKMETRDVNGVPTATSILGVINSNLSITSTVHLVQDYNISYQETPYGDSYIALAVLSLRAVRNY